MGTCENTLRTWGTLMGTWGTLMGTCENTLGTWGTLMGTCFMFVFFFFPFFFSLYFYKMAKLTHFTFFLKCVFQFYSIIVAK